jgi:hypothetical protein
MQHLQATQRHENIRAWSDIVLYTQTRGLNRASAIFTSKKKPFNTQAFWSEFHLENN